MGIHDREYYRDATRGSGWLSGVAPVCKALILANAAIFLLITLDRSGQVQGWLQLTTGDLFHRGQVWRLVTAAFVHHDGWHIAINMLILWVFGRDMEALAGAGDFLAMYLTAAVVGNLCWAGIHFGMGGHPDGAEFGASGAVMGVTALYTLYYPNREVLLFFILPVPMWLLAILYLGQDFLGLMQQVQGRSTASIAFAAHLGGAGYGALYKLYDLRWSRLLGLLNPRRPRFRVVRGDSLESPREYPKTPTPAKSVTASAASRSGPTVQTQSEESLEERVDQILAKIARDGRGSLTEEEHRVLQEASRRAQARRSERH